MNFIVVGEKIYKEVGLKDITQEDFKSLVRKITNNVGKELKSQKDKYKRLRKYDFSKIRIYHNTQQPITQRETAKHFWCSETTVHNALYKRY